MQIQIEDENVKVRSGKSKRTGNEYTLREQSIIVHGVGRFPVVSTLTLPDGVEGYKAGVYDVTTPFNVGRYGLEVSRDLGLVLSKPAQRASA